MSSLVSWIKVSGIPLSFPLPPNSKNKNQTIKPPSSSLWWIWQEHTLCRVDWNPKLCACGFLGFFPLQNKKKKKLHQLPQTKEWGLITSIPKGYLMSSTFSIKHRLVLMPSWELPQPGENAAQTGGAHFLVGFYLPLLLQIALHRPMFLFSTTKQTITLEAMKSKEN